jgi:hypothetical protein
MGHRVHVPCLLQVVSLPFQPRITVNHSEDRMTHFVTLMVPPPQTKHSLRHSTAKVGLWARRFRILCIRKKRPFRAIFVSYSTRFSVPGSTFLKPSGFFPNPCRSHLMRFPLVFGLLVTHSMHFTGRFVVFPTKNYCQPFQMTE